MGDASSLRVGNEERNQVAELLRAAAGEGRLTADECEQRVARTAAAQTYADLDKLVADLPVAPPSQTLLFARPRARDERLGWTPDNPLRLSGGMSTEKRTGYWELPPFMQISGDFGTVKLDCRQAVCLQPIIHLDVMGRAGTITLILPDDWAADTDRMAKSWGTLRNKAARVQLPGKPLLIFEGSAGWGTITVRTARRGERRRLARRMALVPATAPRQLPPASAWVQQNPDLPNASDLR